MGCFCVPQKYPNLCSRLQFFPGVLCHMNVNRWAKNLQMRNIRLLTSKIYFRCTHAKYSMRTTVLHINRSVACFHPQMISRPWSCNIARAVPTIVLLFFSATPFCYGLWGSMSSLRIPSLLQKSFNSPEMYSPPLSLCRAFTCFLDSFSTNYFNSQNFEKVSLFFCMKKIQHLREYSSTNIT